MHVVILDDYQSVALKSTDWSAVEARARITAYHDWTDDHGTLVNRLRDADIIVAMRERTAFPRELLERLPNLRLLVTTGGRNAAIDLDAAKDCGIRVCATGGLLPPTAELTWGLILAAMRHIPAEHNAIRRGQWQTTLGTGLEGKTLGLLGLGRLGTRVAKIGQAFGMNTLAWSQNLTEDTAAAAGVKLATSKHALMAESDVVSIHMVLSERSRGMVGRAELAAMKADAWLINTSRGPLVDESALIAALREGRIGGAALDVFDREPLGRDHPLLELENLIVTPHLGYVTRENYAVFYGDAVADIVAFWDGSPVRVLA